MKEILTLVLTLLCYASGFCQVSSFPLASGSSKAFTFITIDNAKSGDFLYVKSYTQPDADVNAFNVVVGRYSAGSDIATITLTGIPGVVYSWGESLSPSSSNLVTDNEGNIYITAYSSKVITRFNGPIPASGSVTLTPAATYTIANSNGAQPLAIDGSGNLYIGGTTPGYNPCIYKIAKADLLSSGSAAEYLSVSYPEIRDIDFDEPGNIYLSGENSIRKYSASGTFLSTIMYPYTGYSEEDAGDDDINVFASEIAADGSIFFSSGNDHSIVKYDAVTESFSDFAGLSGTSGYALDPALTPPYTEARFGRVVALALNRTGELATFDEGSYKVSMISTHTLGTVLPLYLLNFNADLRVHDLVFFWEMASEKGVDSYILETSSDGISFKENGHVPAISGKKYQQAVSFDPSVRFARLRIIYFNGVSKYSEAIHLGKVKLNPLQAEIKTGQIVIKGDVSGNAQVALYSVGGQLIYQTNTSLKTGYNYLLLPSGLTRPGNIYILHLNRGNKRQTFKLAVRK